VSATVYELRAELDRYGQTGLVMRPDASTEVEARFEQQRRAARTGKFRRGYETGGAGPYDHNVVRRYRHLRYTPG
jgi:hypothetical protein